MDGMIRVFFDFACCPVWHRRKGDDIFVEGFPEQMKDEVELQEIFEEVRKSYVGLFVNNKIEFSYRGFATPKEKEDFLSLLTSGMEKLETANKDRFTIQNEVCIEDL